MNELLNWIPRDQFKIGAKEAFEVLDAITEQETLTDIIDRLRLPLPIRGL